MAEKQEQQKINGEYIQAVNIKVVNQRNMAFNRIAELEVMIESQQAENKKLQETIKGNKS